MSAQVWKFKLAVADRQTLQVPKGAKPLTVQVQNGERRVWMLVNPAAELVAMTICVHGTGHDFDATLYDYIGTAQQVGGALVWHVFRVMDPIEALVGALRL